MPPSLLAQPITVERQIIDDHFDTAGQWDQYDTPDFSARIENGAFLFRLTSQSGFHYAWSVNHQLHRDVLIEADIAFDSQYERAIAGLMCRATGGNSRAYYFLISANGAFSIRRGLEQSTEALVKWQSHRAIFTDGRRNIIRAVCVGDYLGMYANGTYLDGVRDTRYHEGMAGLLIKVPDSAGIDNVAAVRFDHLRAWEAR